jgi:hypothetical protein
MITGMVDELYAYSHHFKWWKEVKLERQGHRSKVAKVLESEEKAEANRPGITEQV